MALGPEEYARWARENPDDAYYDAVQAERYFTVDDSELVTGQTRCALCGRFTSFVDRPRSLDFYAEATPLCRKGKGCQ